VPEPNSTINGVELCGTAAETPRFSHSGGNERYFIFPVEVGRLSGASDRINVVAKESDINGLSLSAGDRVALGGELRSYNNKSGTGSRLVITVLARELRCGDSDDCNEVALTGTICKAPVLRKTPMGRQICDLMLAVNRRYGRSDYIPCIAWGRCAAELARREVGDRVALLGRVQSRTYIKSSETGGEERTAFEVSVTATAAAQPETGD
jgi:single-stranded DNA-binding protein